MAAPSGTLGINALVDDSVGVVANGKLANCGTVLPARTASNGAAADSGIDGAACGMDVNEKGMLPMCSGIACGADGIWAADGAIGGSGGATPKGGAASACGFSL